MENEIIINQYDGYDLAQKQMRREQAQTERARKLIGAVNDFLSRSKSDLIKADMYCKYSVVRIEVQQHDARFSV